MAELDDIYNTRILEHAGAISRTDRLLSPDATATAHSKLCGSIIIVDLKAAGGRVTDFGQNVKACLLGQCAASIVAREIVGTTFSEFRAVACVMRAMLKDNGAAPSGRFADLGVLAPVRAFKARHASTLLVFDAVEAAMAEIEAKGHSSQAAAE